ncbi:MAG: 1-deoxy-D-xylulose-5-phosphate synthase, partial [Candidatus Neomarinimicrobiota bacterium]
MTENQFNKKYPILSKIDFPADLRKLSVNELIDLSSEMREYIIETVTTTGGHLAPSLGVADLTIALHYVFDTPVDKLIWDVGHQAYGHKILTGRKDAIRQIRQYGGISGFCKISESEYDCFGAGHASTSISAAVGIAVARDLNAEKHRVVAIIGDGSFTGGLAYEGLNNAYNVNGQFLVILNDNEMSISRNVGAMSNYFTRIVTSPSYLNMKNQIWNSLALLPRGAGFFRKLGRKLLESFKNFLAPGIIFEEFGFRYYGPIDGHNIPQLINTFNNIKDLKYPVLLHVITQKGKGLASAESDPVKYHGIGPIKKKDACLTAPSAPPFLNAFSEIACEIGDQYEKAVFITAAMAEGTGLVDYSRKFPTRYFDVGIAEGHAVTFAAGLAASGFRPVVAIYSTFLQRAYDHIIHDVALQKLPVVFVLDRGGIVGEDGPTHHGAFDLSYLSTVPNMIISAPRDGNELRNLLKTALDQKAAPFAIRYPKASCVEFDSEISAETYEIGKWEIVKSGNKIAIVSVGVMTNSAVDAVCLLESQNIHPTIVHARFVKPLDTEMLQKIAQNHKLIITIEENSIIGGFGEQVSRYYINQNMHVMINLLAIPDRFIEQGAREILLRNLGLD